MSTPYTPPDYAEWLRQIDAVVLRMTSGADVASYSLGGMTFTNRTLDEVMKHRERIMDLYNEEQAGSSVTLVDNSEDYG